MKNTLKHMEAHFPFMSSVLKAKYCKASFAIQNSQSVCMETSEEQTHWDETFVEIFRGKKKIERDTIEV